MGRTRLSYMHILAAAAGIAAFGLSGPAQAGSSPEPVFSSTPSADGMAIDATDTISLSDTDQSRILTASPEGRIATLVAAPHLAGVDAMGIDDRGDLLMPASRFDRTSGFEAGADAVKSLIIPYSLAIVAKGRRR